MEFVCIFSEIIMADDDSWLYGDDNDEEETPGETVEEATLKTPSLDQNNSELEPPPPIEDAEPENDAEEEKAADDNDSSDESDDDGINFTIDHVKINDAKESYKNMQVKSEREEVRNVLALF